MKRILQEFQRHKSRIVIAGLVCIAVSVPLAAGWLFESGSLFLVFNLGGVLLILAAIFVPGADRADKPRSVRSPVRGRWLAHNSPATKLPSHGTRGYGQSHAIDLVFEPADQVRPEFGSGAAMRHPSDYPAFGEQVFSPVSGTVVRVRDRARDHRSRSTARALTYLYIEGVFRTFGGPGKVVGNHIIVDAGDGCFALVAHLQQGSAGVRAGDVVTAGQLLARCGNSGNSSEPHMHVQLMDRAKPAIALGLPMVFTDVSINGASVTTAMPQNGEYITVE